MSRHGAPVRNRHAIPSTVLRMSIGGRPRPFGTGNSDASTAHCSSVISCRVIMTSTLTARHPESDYQHALVLQPHLWRGAAGQVVASAGAGLVSASPV